MHENETTGLHCDFCCDELLTGVGYFRAESTDGRICDTEYMCRTCLYDRKNTLTCHDCDSKIDYGSGEAFYQINNEVYCQKCVNEELKITA